MKPSWITSGEEFYEYVVNAHRESVNASTVGKGGDGVDIAIFDSVHTPPSGTERAKVGERHRFVDTEKDFTTRHGCRVFDMAWEFSPKSTFSFYQVLSEEGSLTITALADAIDEAISDDVDIVNISAGGEWSGPVEVSPYAREVSRLIDEGITVVAAAGNYDHDGDRPQVFAPAAVDGVIAVGGYVTECPISLTEARTQPERQSGPYYELSNAATANPASPNKLYCGQRGCADDRSCIQDQRTVAWPGNPRERGKKPDVLAPIHCPLTTGGEYNIAYGSSFAAPIVTGVIAEAFGEITVEGKSAPTPRQTREAVRRSAVPLDLGVNRKLNAFEVRTQIRSKAASMSATD